MDSELRPLLEARIRSVPDFPSPGIVFRDITPVLGDAALFFRATAEMAGAFQSQRPTHVAAIESRGFLLGGPIAQQLGAGLIPIRKPGKLPGPVESERYSLEYGADALEIHRDACAAGARVLIVDDVLATGGTALAARRLVERLGAEAIGCAVLIELTFLHARQRLDPWQVRSVVQY